MKGKPELVWRNTRSMPDGRLMSDLNGCTIHTNVVDVIRWPDGTEECAHCVRDRQPAMQTGNPAFHMPPYWEWVK